MKILITNDDGIFAPGIRALAKWAQTLGEVTVVAPKHEQSAKSHGINIIGEFEVKEVDFMPGVRAFSVDSTPADCIRYALIGLGETFDLVLSGINRGVNVGRDIVYSGTVAAIFEANCLGARAAIAMSTEFTSLERAVPHLDESGPILRSISCSIATICITSIFPSTTPRAFASPARAARITRTSL